MLANQTGMCVANSETVKHRKRPAVFSSVLAGPREPALPRPEACGCKAHPQTNAPPQGPASRMEY